jgi:3-mercaptopyruvate sulfurtransferase SseA
VALILRGRGIERVRPLAGGYHAWRDRGYPMTKITMVTTTTTTAASLAPATSGGSYA